MTTSVIILAAGKGTRMKSTHPKVMHPVAGWPMIGHVLNAAHAINPHTCVVVTGFGADEVEDYIGQNFPTTVCVRQEAQNGTGHATQMARPLLENVDGDVVVLYGDVLFVTPERLNTLQRAHAAGEGAITMLTAMTDDPTGLGRIVRDEEGHFRAIVEHKDCSDDELKLHEVNLGTFMLSRELLFELLAEVKDDNAQGEYYLTDIIELAQKRGLYVEALAESCPRALLGINSRSEQTDAEVEIQDMLREAHLANGVTLKDPGSTFFSMDTRIGPDCSLGPNVVFGPRVTLGEGVHIEGDCHLHDTTCEDGATIFAFSHIHGATIGAGATVGPFARLRPGTTLGNSSKVGNFVEIKQASLGAGSKANHLSYIGNAQIGENVNFGVGSAIANYHHFSKAKTQTTIGNGASIGANNALVSPVHIGENAFTAAGTTVTQDVPDGALAIERGELTIKKGYRDRFNDKS